MKKLFICTVLSALIAFLFSMSIFASEISVNYGDWPGKKINFPDQGPVMVNDRVLVPLRGVFEHMGHRVAWEEATRTAAIRSENLAVFISPESDIMVTVIISGDEVIEEIESRLDVRPQIINGRVMIPIRAVSDALGVEVGWHNSTVYIYGFLGQGANESNLVMSYRGISDISALSELTHLTTLDINSNQVMNLLNTYKKYLNI
jgi:hypothetical protein